jgi:O-antigen/teichoic acid export membrane protein
VPELATAPEAISTSSERSLSRQIRAGFGWSLGNMVAARAISLASGVVLARILAPRDYGVFAIALVATELLMSVNDAGLIAAIVRHPGDARLLARTAFTLTLAASGVLYALAFLAAPLFADAFHAPDATAVVRLLTVAILIDGVSAVPSGLLTKGLRQDLRALGDISGLLVTVAVSVALAFLGFGVWSLAWGRLAGNAAAAAIFICLLPFRIWPWFSRSEAKELLDFGLPMAGASLVTFGLLNLHYVVVGGILGPVELGFYVLAFNLSSWPVSLLSQAAQRVSLAGFARLVADHDGLRRAFTKSTLILLAATVPTCLLLSVLAQPLVHVLYGSRWDHSVEVLRFLAVLAGVRVGANMIQDLLAALGHSRQVLGLQVSWVVLLLPALVAGAYLHGIVGASLAQAVVAVAVLPVFLFAVHHAGISIRELLIQLLWLVVAGAAAATAALLIIHAVTGNVTQLLVVGSLATAVFVAVAISTPGLRSTLHPRAWIR